MTYTVLARRWRPRRFTDLVGQEHVVQALVNGLEQDRLHHAFLFTGTRGVGKTTIARILAKSLNCETGVSANPCGECSSCNDIDQGRFVDLLEIDAASRTKVDDTREILDNVQYAPTRGRYKVYLIDEVHMLSLSSFNALLKTLEEPPPHVKFVLATTDPQKIPVTILSRCLRFNLRRLRPAEISEYLTHMLAQESIDWEEGALELIARAADGSMRDGLSLLDQALAYGAGALKEDDTRRMLGMVEQRHIERLLTALSERDAGAMMAVSTELWDMGLPPERILGDLARALHRMAIVQQVADYEDPADLEDHAARALADKIAAEEVQLYYQISLHGLRDLDISPDARMALEMTLLRMAAFAPHDSAPTNSGGTAPTTMAASANAPVKSAPAKPLKTMAQPSQHGRQARGGHAADAAQSNNGAGPELTPPPADNINPSVARPAPDADEAPMPAPVAQAAPTLTADKASEPAAAYQAKSHLPPGDPDVPWQGLVQLLSVSPMTREFAANLHLEHRDEHVWTFVLPKHLGYLQTPRQEQSLLQALREYLQCEIKINIKAREGDFNTPAIAAAAEREAARAAACKAADDDPVMQRLQDRLDARIIPDSIQPLDV